MKMSTLSRTQYVSVLLFRKSIDKSATEKQYNDFGWVAVNEVLNVDEWADIMVS